jgi:transposase-like protein
MLNSPEPAPSCPECHSDQYTKHGWYRSKQRFKCKACNHTFTVDADRQPGIRMLDKFQQFRKLCSHPMPLRTIAAKLNIAVSTAFRWRHIYLAGLVKPEDENLADIHGTALLSTTLVYTTNVVASLAEPDQAIAKFSFGPHLGEPVAVVAHWMPDSDSPFVYSVLTSPLPLTPAAISRLFHLEAAAPGSGVVTARWAAVVTVNEWPGRNGEENRQSRLIISSGLRKLQAAHLGTINSLSFRFRDWMRVFRGVALRYLHNYTTWFNHCKGGCRPASSTSAQAA